MSMRPAAEIGAFGSDMVTNAVAQTVTSGNVWIAIQGMQTATVIATLVELGNVSVAGSWASAVLVGGAVIYGMFTNFTLTSGAVRAYRGVAVSK